MLASNHLAVADSFFLPLVVSRRVTFLAKREYFTAPGLKGRLKKWFVYLNRQESYLQEITVQLRGGHTIKAQRLTGRFIHNGNLANNVTLAFGFNWCSFKFSRYGF